MASAPAAASRIGFVGLGRMGAPMARRLGEAGMTVRGYDISLEARATFARSAGAVGVESLAEVARDVDMVILMLPDSAAVEEVVIGGGLLETLDPATLLLDMSSSEPTSTQSLARRAAERGITLVDAPVSGGVRRAEVGGLTIMVGGPEPAVDRARPVLGVLGERIVHAGPVGAGHAVKALNNLMSAIHLLGTSEAMVVGRAFGLDPAVMLDIINNSTGRSGSTQTKWPDYVLTGSYDSGFGFGLMVKDMRVALTLADQVGTPTRLSRTAMQLWDEAGRALPSTADHTEIARWVQAPGASTTDPVAES